MLSTVLLYFVLNNIHLFITLLVFLLTFLVKYSSNAIHSSPQNSKADCIDDQRQFDQWQLQPLLLLWYIKKDLGKHTGIPF